MLRTRYRWMGGALAITVMAIVIGFASDTKNASADDVCNNPGGGCNRQATVYARDQKPPGKGIQQWIKTEPVVNPAMADGSRIPLVAIFSFAKMPCNVYQCNTHPSQNDQEVHIQIGYKFDYGGPPQLFIYADVDYKTIQTGEPGPNGYMAFTDVVCLNGMSPTYGSGPRYYGGDGIANSGCGASFGSFGVMNLGDWMKTTYLFQGSELFLYINDVAVAKLSQFVAGTDIQFDYSALEVEVDNGHSVHEARQRGFNAVARFFPWEYKINASDAWTFGSWAMEDGFNPMCDAGAVFKGGWYGYDQGSYEIGHPPGGGGACSYPFGHIEGTYP